MSDPDTEALIVDNIADLEAAMDVASALDDTLIAAIAQTTEAWAEAAGWLSDTDFEGEDFYVAPATWKVGDDWRAWFALESDDSGGNDNFYLTGFVGKGREVERFVLKQEVCGRIPWKKLLAQQGELLRATALQVNEKGEIHLPFRLDASRLAAAIREDSAPDAALDPFRAILDQLKAAVPAVEELLRIAEQTGTA